MYLKNKLLNLKTTYVVMLLIDNFLKECENYIHNSNTMLYNKNNKGWKIFISNTL